MKNMNTTLEIPEGSKATIAGKNIDGKYYLVVEVEEREEPEWKKFKRGDVLVNGDIMVMFWRYVLGCNDVFIGLQHNSSYFKNCAWESNCFTHASNKQKADFFKYLREKGLEWDGEKLVEVLKEGDLAIFWDHEPREAIIAVYRGFLDGRYFDHLAMYWDNAIKWDGTKEQYEKVLRGEL